MATPVPTRPSADSPAGGVLSVELELTGNCQLECSHCCTLSGPEVTQGAMTLTDWQQVVDDIAALGIPAVQFIGGEPTRSLTLLPLITHALCRELKVEVYSNLTHVRLPQWAAFEQYGVRLATSYYSDDPAEHDRITGVAGSHARTRANIIRAVERRIPLRAGVVQLEDAQRVDAAVAELRELGVTNIRVDRVRAVGRAAETVGIPSVSELCGRCFHHRLAISPDGDLYGCILSRFLPTGNVRQRRLADIMLSPEYAAARAAIPPMSTDGCPPDDSSDCNPANTEACGPAYDD
ncbi:radical SAM protein [Streptomyces genisteinicus]|uniref:Radical SAM protein n=1 Tax=Streptomyces genisteinicus TaxID=2768068 RepID=A0A7H0HZM7_9ACTN|nr:radical SAM protein [Streptomyces genisteinicus]QNP65993.1 radical SAM protein [Streptomyces genisteinicus]